MAEEEEQNSAEESSVDLTPRDRLKELEDDVGMLKSFLATSYNDVVTHFDERITKIEQDLLKIKNSDSVNVAELEALVVKMHDKMKLLIPMED